MEKVKYWGRLMFEEEREMVKEAEDTPPFLTMAQCAKIAHMYHGKERTVEQLSASIQKAASPARGQILVRRREGSTIMVDVRSFYEWLDNYQPHL